eukprot:TRINITY_DN72785_c0_g1_i1.p1 TRINITY_DN72785_c0_g1~~TRINITY_DN72785_c0_g1_i1.p1  ORF type:complete len:453 (-),score=55.97 TRINITY_DN72785_c0_g1_i1:193-1551(-)
MRFSGSVASLLALFMSGQIAASKCPESGAACVEAQNETEESALINLRHGTKRLTPTCRARVPAVTMTTPKVAGLVELGFDFGVSRVFPSYGNPPGEMVNSCFDTGSAATWVQTPTCEVVGAFNSFDYPQTLIPDTGDNQTCHLQMGSFMAQSTEYCFSEGYGIGSSIAGFVSTERVNLGNVSYTQRIGVVNYMASSFLKDEVGGIVGMGPMRDTQTQEYPPSLRAHGDFFTICLPQCQARSPGQGSCYPPSFTRQPGDYSGFACFGCEPACSIPSSSTWVSAGSMKQDMPLWMLPLSSMMLEDATGNSSVIATGETSAAVDSGTALICVDPQTKDNIFKSISDRMLRLGVTCSESAGMVQALEASTLSCPGARVVDWPTYVLAVGTVILKLDPQYLVTDSGDGGTHWTIQHAPLPATGNSIVLGAAFHNNFYTKISVSDNEMFFAGQGVFKQ